jgi:transposase InsO family protein
MVARTKSLRPYNEAPPWNQQIADARKDFLDLVDKHLEPFAESREKDAVLRRVLKTFNKGLLGDRAEDIRSRLRGRKTSRTNYYKWKSLFEQRGISGLLDNYGRPGCRIRSDHKREIEKVIWESHPELIRYRDVQKDLEVVLRRKVPYSYNTIKSFVKHYIACNKAALIKKCEGNKGLRDRNMSVCLGKADACITRPNQRWETDATIADVLTGESGTIFLTADGKRKRLIGTADVYPRALRFHLVDAENADAVIYVIKDLIQRWGLPELIVIDNGRPFKNKKVLNFLRNLGIAVWVCTPGHPEQKPFVERGFGTLTGRCLRRLSGYTGNSVKNRPAIIEVAYTAAELQQIIDDWTDFDYMEAVHSSTGQRPRERMRPPGFTPKTVAPRELDGLAFERFERKVRGGCVQYDGGKYFHKKLPEGQTVTIAVNDFEASEVLVFVDGIYKWTAVDVQRQGFTPKEIKRFKAERNQEHSTRIKAGEALLDKGRRKDQRIHDHLAYKKEQKPVELPQKAQVLQFPELAGAQYTGPGTTEVQDGPLHEDDAQDVELFGSRKEKYLHLKRRKLAGEQLNSVDEGFVEEFEASNEYRMIKARIDWQLSEGKAS